MLAALKELASIEHYLKTVDVTLFAVIKLLVLKLKLFHGENIFTQ